MTRFKILGALAIASMFVNTGANAAIVAGSFNVTSAQLLSLYSGTLDPACTPGGGFFFCGTIPAGTVSVASSVGGSGTINVLYDNSNGDVTEITSIDMNLADLVITITGSAFGSGVVTVVQGNSFPTVTDAPKLRAGTATGQAGVLLQPAGVPTADVDADQDATVGLFRHDAPGSVNDAPDFAVFSQIVDSCVSGGAVCFLIPGLAIDGVRYEIVGTVSGGTYNGTIRAETGNNSNYFVSFASTEVPVPAAVWLFGSALGLLGVARRKRMA